MDPPPKEGRVRLSVFIMDLGDHLYESRWFWFPEKERHLEESEGKRKEC